MDDEGPKWRLEHADNGTSVCQRAACKEVGVKIVKGELRIGTHTLFYNENDIKQRWYMAWRHWGCATKHQIAGLKEITGGDPTKAPGYDRLSPESQEQVRLAFENGMPVDKSFKDIREDLAKTTRKYSTEYRDAIGYKADVATRAAACRGSGCLSNNVKITKGHLRLGIYVDFDGEHSSTYYKHWKCMSVYDLEHAKIHFEDGTFDGIDMLSEELKEVVLESLKTGEVVEPPEPAIEPPKTKKKTKKSQSKKTTAKPALSITSEESEALPEEPKIELEEAPPPPAAAKPKTKKPRAKKRPTEKMDSGSEFEPEYVPKKSKSRSVPFKEAATPVEAAASAPEEQISEDI